MMLLNITRAREGLAQSIQAVNVALLTAGPESDEYREAIREREQARAEMRRLITEITKEAAQ